LQELKSRFKEQTMELITLSTSLDPSNNYKKFNIDNIYNVSSKSHDQLQVAQAINITNMIVDDELQISKGANKVVYSKKSWIYLMELYNFIEMYDAIIIVIGIMIDKRGMLLLLVKCYCHEFIFILHLMFEIIRITNILCQTLQSHYEDILNSTYLVSTTKTLFWKKLQKLNSRFIEQIVKLLTLNTSLTLATITRNSTLIIFV
ncbi:hypothetical protein CR513_51595, partial [Mucuna pruriens]